jgi:hypothetical protein
MSNLPDLLVGDRVEVRCTLSLLDGFSSMPSSRILTTTDPLDDWHVPIA